MLNGEREVAWFWLLHAILLTIFVASFVPAFPGDRAQDVRRDVWGHSQRERSKEQGREEKRKEGPHLTHNAGRTTNGFTFFFPPRPLSRSLIHPSTQSFTRPEKAPLLAGILGQSAKPTPHPADFSAPYDYRTTARSGKEKKK